MNHSHCRPIVKHIEAFVDGELMGVDRLRVSQHLMECPDCAGIAQRCRGLGETIRLAAQVAPVSRELAGLSTSVMSRLQAEQAQSWRALFGHAIEDWRWALVGTGSVAATFVSALFVSVVLIAGPRPERQDSLAARFNNFGASTGPEISLSAEAASSAIRQAVAGAEASVGDSQSALESGLRTESDMVQALAATVTHDGRFVDLGSMPTATRFRAETLSYDINRMRSSDRMPGLMMRTTASVIAKGL